MHLDFTEEAIDWAMTKLGPLFRRRGAPESLADRHRYAAAVFRIAHPQLVLLRCRDHFKKPPDEEIVEALKFTGAQLDAVRVNGVNPLAWLVDKVLDDNRWFLEPVDMLVVFIEKFPCADGRKHAAPAKEREK